MDAEHSKLNPWYLGDGSLGSVVLQFPTSHPKSSLPALATWEFTVKGKGKGRQFVQRITASMHMPLMRFPSLTRAACRTATVYSLQTQAGAAAG